MATEANFNGLASQFNNEYERSVKGALRYSRVHQNLAPYVRPGLTVLDVCGGSGPDTAWFAQQGCTVTLLEPSEEQLTFAQDRFASELTAEERARIKPPINGELDEIPDRVKFDIVALHGVSMYKEFPNPYRTQALRHVKQRGILSLLETGRAAAKRTIDPDDYKERMRFDNEATFINNVGRLVHAASPYSLQTFAEDNGTVIRLLSGVRATDDYEADERLRKDIPQPEWSRIVASDAAVGNTPDGAYGAQMIHAVLRRPRTIV